MIDQWREVEAEWQDGGAFIGSNASGGTVQMGKLDGRPGISPMELILVGLAGCTGVDIIDILHKKRQPVKAFKIKVRGLRAEDFPKVYKQIEIVYMVWGDGVEPTAVERSIQLSQEKYCSVSAMLSSTAHINCSYKIFPSSEIRNS